LPSKRFKRGIDWPENWMKRGHNVEQANLSLGRHTFSSHAESKPKIIKTTII
jgi:hypothetical protein